MTVSAGHACIMFILCSGADTFRSLQKVRELEAAYRAKHDQAGVSVQHLPSGKDGIDPLLSAMSGGSLFSTRRFLRADDLVSGCPKAKRDALIRALARDADDLIVVCLESSEVTTTECKPFASLPKFFHYQFPLLSPAEFMDWAMGYASSMGFTDARAIRSLVDRVQGDTWAFISEFAKVQAGGEMVEKNSGDLSIFTAIDGLLEQRQQRHTILRQLDDPDAVIAQTPGQLRSALLVQSGYTKGIHPFVLKKVSRLRFASPARLWKRLAGSFVWSRSSHASAEESLDILG